MGSNLLDGFATGGRAPTSTAAEEKRITALADQWLAEHGADAPSPDKGRHDADRHLDPDLLAADPAQDWGTDVDPDLDPEQLEPWERPDQPTWCPNHPRSPGVRRIPGKGDIRWCEACARKARRNAAKKLTQV